MREGKLPNFKKLADLGSYTRLKTTFPSLSPVAWSSFSTGTNPGRHNIFDFLDRDRRTYLPLLSSTYIGKVERFLKLGKYRIPLHRPALRLLRKSRPFWSILGEHHIWSTILRVPITFPPDRFHGAQLSAMSVPDLLGTQGRSCCTRTARRAAGSRRAASGSPSRSTATGRRRPSRDRTTCSSRATRPLKVPLRITLDRTAQVARIELNGKVTELEPGTLSDWVTIALARSPASRCPASAG